MFSFTCTGCGRHSSGDFTENVICKVGGRYRQGKFSPYNKSSEGIYYSVITLTDGGIVLPDSTEQLLCRDLKNYEIATEVYCNGILEACADEVDVRHFRFCRPIIRL